MVAAKLFGGTTHTRQQVEAAYTPGASKSYTPVPYSTLLNTVDRVLQDNELAIASEEHQLVKPMKDVSMPNAYSQYFGVLKLANLNDDRNEVGFAIGLRSSHDKTLSNSICAGSNVFVCENLCFSAEWSAFRKHTSNVLSDLPKLIDSIIKQFPEAQASQGQLFDKLRETKITPQQALWLVYRGADANAVGWRDIRPIMEELESDRNKLQHDDGSDSPTLWRLYNAGTEVHKGIQGKNMVRASTRSLNWHNLFNKAIKLGVEKV